MEEIGDSVEGNNGDKSVGPKTESPISYHPTLD